MKYILKLITGFLFMPWLILGGLIAVVRTLFTLTFEMAWEKGDDWYVYLLGKSDDFLQWLKK